jgi:hypothetical protein
MSDVELARAIQPHLLTPEHLRSIYNNVRIAQLQEEQRRREEDTSTCS